MQQILADPSGQKGRGKIACHDGPDVPGMGADAGGGEHTEDTTEGNAVKNGAVAAQQGNKVIIQQDEQPEHADIHDGNGNSVPVDKVGAVARILQKREIIPDFAAHQQGKENTQTEQNDAEQVANRLRGELQADILIFDRANIGAAPVRAQNDVKNTAQEKRHQADGKGSGIEIVIFVHRRRMGQHCRQEKADKNAYSQRQ